MRFTELLTERFRSPRWRHALTTNPDPLIRAAVRKLAGREVAEAAGIRTPRLLAVRDNLHGLDWSRLPQRYVIKADRAAGCHGVLAMDGRYDVLHCRTLTREEMTAVTDTWQRPLLIEEAVIGHDGQYPPRDYKVWCFGPHVELVNVCERAGPAPWKPGHGWYGPDWARYHTVYLHPPNRLLPPVPPPRRLAQLLAAASQLGRLVPPFIRVDFYLDTAGPVFGEFCCDPNGRLNYDPIADEHLGRIWLQHAQGEGG